MARKRHTAEQIIAKLRQAEIELSKGKSTAEGYRAIGVHQHAYHRWRKEYGGMGVDRAY